MSDPSTLLQRLHALNALGAALHDVASPEEVGHLATTHLAKVFPDHTGRLHASQPRKEDTLVLATWGTSVDSPPIARADLLHRADRVGQLELWGPEEEGLQALADAAAHLVSLGLRTGRSRASALLPAALDPLTGLLSDTTFRLALHREFSRASREASPLLMLSLDLDGQPGDPSQPPSDAQLRAAGEAVRRAARVYDVVGRMGPRRFGVVLVNSSLRDAEARAKVLVDAIAATGVAPLGVRIGCSGYPEHHDDPGQVVQAAVDAVPAHVPAGHSYAVATADHDDAEDWAEITNIR